MEWAELIGLVLDPIGVLFKGGKKGTGAGWVPSRGLAECCQGFGANALMDLEALLRLLTASR
jgi:hypothetical protein